MNPPSSSVVVGSVLLQCAESKVYECDFYGYPAVCKHRFCKEYRHPTLDHKLREQRTVREARALVRCCKHGVEAPIVYAVDREQCVIVMSRIEGLTVREILNKSRQSGSPVATRILTGIGEIVGLLHNADIIHGDLTTSNFICVSGPSETAAAAGLCRKGLVVLDFGLVTDKNSAEERAVDLYVLERAIKSSHPFLGDGAAALVLEGYGHTIDAQKGAATLARLEAVRARGRKRSMVG